MQIFIKRNLYLKCREATLITIKLVKVDKS